MWDAERDWAKMSRYHVTKTVHADGVGGMSLLSHNNNTHTISLNTVYLTSHEPPPSQASGTIPFLCGRLIPTAPRRMASLGPHPFHGTSPPGGGEGGDHVLPLSFLPRSHIFARPPAISSLRTQPGSH